MNPETNRGPIIDPIPISMPKVALADTISLGCKKSFVWATVSEYIGKQAIEKRPVKIKNNVSGIKLAKTKNKLKPEAIKETPIRITRLSILSDKYPIGHWDRAPADVMIIIYKEISNKLKLIDEAYIAPYPKTALWDKPVAKAPTKPKGETV